MMLLSGTGCSGCLNVVPSYGANLKFLCTVKARIFFFFVPTYKSINIDAVINI